MNPAAEFPSVVAFATIVSSVLLMMNRMSDFPFDEVWVKVSNWTWVGVGVACAGLVAGSTLGTPAAAASAAAGLCAALASWPRPPRQKRAAAELAHDTAGALWEGLLSQGGRAESPGGKCLGKGLEFWTIWVFAFPFDGQK